MLSVRLRPGQIRVRHLRSRLIQLGHVRSGLRRRGRSAWSSGSRPTQGVLWISFFGAAVLWCGLCFPSRLEGQTPLPTESTPAPSPGTGGVNPGLGGAVPQASQTVTPNAAGPANAALAPLKIGPGLPNSIWQWKGLPVESIRFEGVRFDDRSALPKELAQKVAQPLDPDKVRESTRRLFSSGRYHDIAVRGVRTGGGVGLIFSGSPQYFVGRVVILGVKSERLSSLLEYATKLDPGTSFSEAQIPAGTQGIVQSLAQNGFYEPKVGASTARDAVGHQVNVTYTVNTGPQARVGAVTVTGTDPGLTEKNFRKKGKLKLKSKVTRETTSTALDNLRAVYQKNDRLEGTITLEKQVYDASTDRLNYTFRANQGPKVKVLIEGIKVSKSRLKLLVPVFEEGAVDNDLLNEGKTHIRDFVEQQGYFDAEVDYHVIGEDTPEERVVYTVDRRTRHKVIAVNFQGNKYLSDDILREHVRVQKADAYIRNGRYSTALVRQDVSSIEAIYRANGFSAVKVTAGTKDVDEKPNGKPLKEAAISVTYTIDQGLQQKFGEVKIEGVDASRRSVLAGLINAQTGQPYSLITLSGDRDAVLGYYVSHGFDQARVEIKQQKETADPTRTDVALDVTEGQQVTVYHVLESGLGTTKQKVVDQQVLVHAGDPLDQSALLETQRNLYNLALFNEVVAAVQNPTGDAPEKNVLLQLTEARRWDVTYGFGFEAQTGRPTRGRISEASAILLGIPPSQTSQYSQNGKAGVSPRVSLDVSRINFRGTQQSLTFHGTYGLLEEVATATFNNPNLFGSKKLTAIVSGGYTNVQNISTFAAATLQADLRVTQKVKRADTFIYDFQYRRVKVDPNSLQISANLIPLLSQPVRVGGPGVTWFHDTRSPSPLDAVKGSYTSVQEFYADPRVGSQTNFNRVDATNSTYYQFGKGDHKYVFARNLRVGFENVFGANPNANATNDATGGNPCAGVLLNTNPSCTAVPLPERLYAGGATSLRGFSINGAGPRDLQTGYPVGGTAVVVNTFELRMPPPVLPVVGSSVSFVLFHDMGNVFQNGSKLFPSIGRFHQPNSETCRDISSAAVVASHIGTCDFNYFSHDVGLGARYSTPVGPIRADFSYNLNPPIYPVIYDFNGSVPHVGQASHFNFFFSIGQSF